MNLNFGLPSTLQAESDSETSQTGPLVSFGFSRSSFSNERCLVFLHLLTRELHLKSHTSGRDLLSYERKKENGKNPNAITRSGLKVSVSAICELQLAEVRE